MEITRTADSDTTTWTGTIAGTPVAWLSVWTANGEICDLEVATAHQGQGLARAIYTHADNDFGGIFHTIEQHRTEQGNAFVHAIGGDVIDDADALVIDVCCCDHCS